MAPPPLTLSDRINQYLLQAKSIKLLNLLNSLLNPPTPQSQGSVGQAQNYNLICSTLEDVPNRGGWDSLLQKDWTLVSAWIQFLTLLRERIQLMLPHEVSSQKKDKRRQAIGLPRVPIDLGEGSAALSPVPTVIDDSLEAIFNHMAEHPDKVFSRRDDRIIIMKGNSVLVLDYYKKMASYVGEHPNQITGRKWSRILGILRKYSDVKMSQEEQAIVWKPYTDYVVKHPNQISNRECAKIISILKCYSPSRRNPDVNCYGKMNLQARQDVWNAYGTYVAKHPKDITNELFANAKAIVTLFRGTQDIKPDTRKQVLSVYTKYIAKNPRDMSGETLDGVLQVLSLYPDTLLRGPEDENFKRVWGAYAHYVAKNPNDMTKLIFKRSANSDETITTKRNASSITTILKNFSVNDYPEVYQSYRSFLIANPRDILKGRMEKIVEMLEVFRLGDQVPNGLGGRAKTKWERDSQKLWTKVAAEILRKGLDAFEPITAQDISRLMKIFSALPDSSYKTEMLDQLAHYVSTKWSIHILIPPIKNGENYMIGGKPFTKAEYVLHINYLIATFYTAPMGAYSALAHLLVGKLFTDMPDGLKLEDFVQALNQMPDANDRTKVLTAFQGYLCQGHRLDFLLNSGDPESDICAPFIRYYQLFEGADFSAEVRSTLDHVFIEYVTNHLQRIIFNNGNNFMKIVNIFYLRLPDEALPILYAIISQSKSNPTFLKELREQMEGAACKSESEYAALVQTGGLLYQLVTLILEGEPYDQELVDALTPQKVQALKIQPISYDDSPREQAGGSGSRCTPPPQTPVIASGSANIVLSPLEELFYTHFRRSLMQPSAPPSAGDGERRLVLALAPAPTGLQSAMYYSFLGVAPGSCPTSRAPSPPSPPNDNVEPQKPKAAACLDFDEDGSDSNDPSLGCGT